MLHWIPQDIQTNHVGGVSFSPLPVGFTSTREKKSVLKTRIRLGHFKKVENLITEQVKDYITLDKIYHSVQDVDPTQSLVVLNLKQDHPTIKGVYVRHIIYSMNIYSLNHFYGEVWQLVDKNDNIIRPTIYWDSHRGMMRNGQHAFIYPLQKFGYLYNKNVKNYYYARNGTFGWTWKDKTYYHHFRSIPYEDMDQLEKLICAYGRSAIAVYTNEDGNKQVRIESHTNAIKEGKEEEKTTNITYSSSDLSMEFDGNEGVKIKTKKIITNEFAMIGYKLAKVKDEEHLCIVKLGIYPNSCIAMAGSEQTKMRTDRCKVLAIGKLIKTENNDYIYDFGYSIAESNQYLTDFLYPLGIDVIAEGFNRDLSQVCVPGIHFFTTQDLAMEYSNISYGVLLDKEKMENRYVGEIIERNREEKEKEEKEKNCGKSKSARRRARRKANKAKTDESVFYESLKYDKLETEKVTMESIKMKGEDEINRRKWNAIRKTRQDIGYYLPSFPQSIQFGTDIVEKNMILPIQLKIKPIFSLTIEAMDLAM